MDGENHGSNPMSKWTLGSLEQCRKMVSVFFAPRKSLVETGKLNTLVPNTKTKSEIWCHYSWCDHVEPAECIYIYIGMSIDA